MSETNELIPKTDREILLLLHQKVDTMDRRIGEQMATHDRSDTENFAIIKRDISAAHKRMDGYKLEFGKLLSWKDKVLGGTAVLGFLFSAIISIVAVLRH